MARIKINDIPKNRKIGIEEMRNVLGGHKWEEYMKIGQVGGARSKWRKGSKEENRRSWFRQKVHDFDHRAGLA